MNSGALPLLARLGEAASFPQAVRHYESDPWSYLRRKLGSCEGPLSDYKQALFKQASERLFSDLNDPELKPEMLLDHKETFEKLLSPDDFSEFLLQLDAAGKPAARIAGVRRVLGNARIKTLFDVESMPVERRGKPWQTLVDDTWRRMRLDKLKAILERKPRTDRRRAYIARRARRNLGDFLAVTRGQAGLRDEITLFVLTRVEAVIAAQLRLLNNR